MALINCPECGQKVSDKAPTCIHCGYPLAKTKICPEYGESVSDDESVCKNCGYPFETASNTEIVSSETREVSESENDDALLTEETAVGLLNYIQFSVAKIINGKSKGLLEDEFNAVINNINPASLQDSELISAYDTLLSTLTELKLNENQREQVAKIIDRQRKTAFTNCLNSFGSVFVPGANPITLISSFAYTGISAALNYRHAVTEVEIEEEEKFFEINQNDLAYIDRLRADLFISAAKLFSNKTNSVTGLISENEMKILAEQANIISDCDESDERLDSCIAILTANEKNLKNFPPYWKVLGSAYLKNLDYGSLFDVFINFCNLLENDQIFKKNPYWVEYSKELIYAWSNMIEEGQKDPHIVKLVESSIEIIIDNISGTTNELDNMNYYLAPVYASLGKFDEAYKCLSYL